MMMTMIGKKYVLYPLCSFPFLYAMHWQCRRARADSTEILFSLPFPFGETDTQDFSTVKQTHHGESERQEKSRLQGRKRKRSEQARKQNPSRKPKTNHSNKRKKKKISEPHACTWCACTFRGHGVGSRDQSMQGMHERDGRQERVGWALLLVTGR